MADLKVEIVKITEIKPHSNADRMELAFIGGWQSCVPIGKFKAGDRAIYIPVDCILPSDVENILFPPGSKVKLSNSRVRSIRLRGAMSQGMLEYPETLGLDPNIKVGTDVAKKLGITKYHPPESKKPGMMKAKAKKHKNPNFKIYTNISHFKYYIDALVDMMVFATEKVHGTNFRAGWVKYNAFNWWRKILYFLKLIPSHEFAYGSHRVELTRKARRSTGFYKQNVYYMMAEKYNLRQILGRGEVIYAEIYGHGIQKGYAYGCKENEWKMAVVDVMVNGKYLDGIVAQKFCEERGLPYAPVVYIGKFNYDELNALANPPNDASWLYPTLQRPVEGIVVQPYREQNFYGGRMVFKWINDEYWLAKGNTDWH